jgi:hypothetical protein
VPKSLVLCNNIDSKYVRRLEDVTSHVATYISISDMLYCMGFGYRLAQWEKESRITCEMKSKISSEYDSHLY